MTESSTQETRLWLLRHPEPDASVAEHCYGSLDVALSERGIRHARVIAGELGPEALSAIYTSPLQRCAEAARILADRRPAMPVVVDALRELDFGEFEGRSYADIEKYHPDLYRQWMERPDEVRFPGGDSLEDLQARVIPAVRDLRLRHAGESVAIMTHGGVIRVLLADALGMAPSHLFRIGQRYGAINLIRYFGDVPVVELINAKARS